MMDITLVSPFDPRPPRNDGGRAHVGGVERVFAELAPRLVRRGHEVTLLCSTDGPSAWTEEDGIQVHRIRRTGTLMRTPVVDLSRHIPSDSDVVHVAATYPFTTPRVLRRAARMGIPGVLDFHFEPDPGHSFGRAAARVYRHVGPPSYRYAQAALVRSLAYGRAAPSLQVVPEERWRVLPNGIDPAVFHPDGSRQEGDYLLCVGRLIPYKGVGVLIEALARGRIEVPLVVAGDGPLRPRLEAQAKELGVDVRFLGYVPDELLPALYRGARLTILPSVNGQEAFGITLLESMACGTPVVGAGLPGVADVAAFGGRVARPRDPSSLAHEIRAALEDGNLQRGEALAWRVHATYSWDVVAARLLEVYTEVVEGGAPTARAASSSHMREGEILCASSP